MVANEDPAEDPRILAILDTGCNNICDGDKWMQRFAEAHGNMPEIEKAMGKFRDVDGKVMVAGKRPIPMRMRTLDDEMIAGTITLQDSEAPLQQLNKRWDWFWTWATTPSTAALWTRSWTW